MVTFFNLFQKGHYDTVSEVAGDLNVMFENAKKYNRPDSKLYKVCIHVTIALHISPS